jgi:hypothetical protein
VRNPIGRNPACRWVDQGALIPREASDWITSSTRIGAGRAANNHGTFTAGSGDVGFGTNPCCPRERLQTLRKDNDRDCQYPHAWNVKSKPRQQYGRSQKIPALGCEDGDVSRNHNGLFRRGTIPEYHESLKPHQDHFRACRLPLNLDRNNLAAWFTLEGGATSAERVMVLIRCQVLREVDAESFNSPPPAQAAPCHCEVSSARCDYPT